jgi:hypothetical protein
MRGQHFVFIENTPTGRNFRTGIVKQAVGAERFLLEFQGKGYHFSNVLNSEQLERFAFFNTPAERDAFIAEVIDQLKPAISEAAPSLDAAP